MIKKPPDTDGDGIVDANDNCPVIANTNQTNSDTDNLGDACDTDDDNDSIEDPTDIDDDNDGLIEIATAAELNNMRHDLAGHSYDDEADDGADNEGDNTGAPTSPTTLCPDETSSGSGIYLCGYELGADITLPASGEAGDLNDVTAGNVNPIGEDTDGNRFTAIFEGNGYRIINLDIDRIIGIPAANDDTNDAALLAACENTSITNLILENPSVRGRRRVGALCGTMAGVTVSEVHIDGSMIQGDSDSSFDARMGGLAGWVSNNSLIENCTSSGNISNGGDGG